MIATFLSDFGAEVIKLEHPGGGSLRTLGWQKDGVPLWWTLTNRNKACATLNLAHPDGQRLIKELVAGADVLIEGFRPGRMEAWGLGYEELSAINPGLVMVRVSGFGQSGPYRDRPGFGTLAESMSGFAHINGFPDRPPSLPPFALGDMIAALFGTFSTLIALRERDSGDHTGQEIDLSIYEPLFSILGPQALVYDQLGIVQGRMGNRVPFSAFRNAFQAKDGMWLGLSASSQNIATRLMRLVGREDIVEQPWFGTPEGQLEHAEEIDEILRDWIGGRTGEEVLELFEKSEAAIAPIYSIADIMEDPHFAARETITTLAHDTLGPVKIQGVVPHLSKTPGKVSHLGRDLGADNHSVFVELLGHSESELIDWSENGVI
jgi:formyl-CoA transferase